MGMIVKTLAKKRPIMTGYIYASDAI
jgi:hypothetical protein